MIKLIMGLKGAGKTKQLISDINESVKTESGSIVCIENGTKLRYDIDRRVRLVEYQDYKDGRVEFLKGFVSGMHANNFDISHIFIDSFYKLMEDATIQDVEDFVLWCERFSEANRVAFTIIISEDPSKATDVLKKYL
ncbi:MAG: hypothetical protein IJB35_00445 [Oscillospiraceae bacterium]|nr:hypothetical protein [Oscillospiraceae bacterium]